MTIGIRLLVSLMEADDGLETFVRLRLEPEIFASAIEKELFGFVLEHAKKYGKLPDKETCEANGVMITVPSNLPEPPMYYYDKCRERHVFNRLKSMLMAVEGDLNNEQAIPALDRMLETMTLCQLFLSKDRMMDFTKEGLGMIHSEYVKQALEGDDYGLKLGWKYIDEMTGGLGAGDLISIVGRPGMGKTYLMLCVALAAWHAKKTPLVISMEMDLLSISQRTAAMITRKPVTALKKGELEGKSLTNMLDQLASLKTSDTPFWIVDGALTATVDDVVLLARQLKPAVVLIDGAYMLRNNDLRLSRNEKLAENVVRLKSDLAKVLGIPVLLSYQFNRQFKSDGKDTPMDMLAKIAGTDEIGKISSLVLGLLQQESVETLRRRRVEILKGRNGEQGAFEINWNFDVGPKYMDFSQVEAENKSDMEFL